MNIIPKTLSTDYIVIGSGVAGLRAAIGLAPAGNVLVVTKDRPSESSSEYAQGGVAVVMSEEDEVSFHYRDTMRAGSGLCRPDAVKILVEDGMRRIGELIEWGAEFDREGVSLAFAREAAHSRRRILRAKGDSTGREIVRVLLDRAKGIRNISRLSHSWTVDLIVDGDRCLGVILVKGKEVMECRARAVVLATGGAGQLFSRTTNPPVATGDGFAMAYRAGAVLEDMEFVQFHPTSLFFPGAPQFLLSEAMRGEGGILINASGERFMNEYHRDAELAPRDVVSRAIVSEMVKTGSKHVYLDMTRLPASFVKERFPRIYETCLGYDIDITEEPVPVSPAAHYIMGGVKTDMHGATSLKGLYAAGEVSCTGVHGANRLASNSLLEALVLGARAAEAASSYGEDGGQETPHVKALKGTFAPPPDMEKIRSSLRRVMWEKVGIIRCAESLGRAAEVMAGWSGLMDAPLLSRRGLELKNMITTGSLILSSAIQRENSVGAHYRSDFAEKGRFWRGHIRVKKEAPKGSSTPGKRSGRTGSTHLTPCA